MNLALLAMSHSPLLGHVELDERIASELDTAFDRAREFVNQFKPDLVVVFAPDHYNGFFYNVMPAFCIGCAADSIGDYDGQTGPLDVPRDIAHGLAEAVIGDGIDVAISMSMQVDHGFVQPLEIVFGDIRAKPVVPVFVNGVAPPFTPLSRVRLLGESVGCYLQRLNGNVLVVASGGLSHDPPVPRFATATPEQRRMLLGEMQPLDPEARHARQQRVITAAANFANNRSNIQDLAPTWDEAFLDIVASGELNRFDAWTPDEMKRAAGNSAHEVRTWIAAYAALSSAGEYAVDYRYYHPIKSLIAGFAVTTANLVDTP